MCGPGVKINQLKKKINIIYSLKKFNILVEKHNLELEKNLLNIYIFNQKLNK